MTIDILTGVFGWCAIINIGLLFWWFLFFAFAHDWVYRMHNRWYNITVEAFDRIHYAGLMIFKTAVFVFTVVPYFALRIVGS